MTRYDFVCDYNDYGIDVVCIIYDIIVFFK